jgi:hypothetical protein
MAAHSSDLPDIRTIGFGLSLFRPVLRAISRPTGLAAQQIMNGRVGAVIAPQLEVVVHR